MRQQAVRQMYVKNNSAVMIHSHLAYFIQRDIANHPVGPRRPLDTSRLQVRRIFRQLTSLGALLQVEHVALGRGHWVCRFMYTRLWRLHDVYSDIYDNGPRLHPIGADQLRVP